MDINDLCTLDSVDEDAVVNTVKERYESDYIYIYIGDILISINPCKDVPLNSEQVSRRYKNERTLARTDAHVFGIVNNMHQCLTVNAESQCFVVSGESGSGKTEIVKLAVRHFLSLGPLNHSCYTSKLLQISTILEAFGNALTDLNKSASRFANFLQLYFSNDFRVCGVSVAQYLLEKSRISNFRQGERTFHIFYYMFSGRTDDELSRQLLDSPSQHRYLKYGDAFGEDLSMWSDKYKELKQAFFTIGFTIEETTEIYGVLAAVLHIGDVKFKCQDPSTGVFIENMEVLDKVSILLGVETSDLELCLTCNLVAKDENVSGFKSESDANQTRDSFSKNLYTRLFSWIVHRINSLLNPEELKKKRLEHVMVGFLDVFGFEDLQRNSLEQLCINTTNEQIALHFTQHVFALEQVEYEQERLLDMEMVEYFDNRNIINLLLEKPHGILSLLEEESRCLQADEQTLVSSLNAHCSNHKHYMQASTNTPAFSVVHYNKKVTYSTEEFLNKNNDKLEGTLIECLRGSSSIVISTLFNSSVTKTGSLSFKTGSGASFCCVGDLRTAYEKRTNYRLNKDAKCNTNKACHNTKSKQKTLTSRKQKNALTASTYFRNSLVDLMEKILLCQAHFVRCIKPNKRKEANCFDTDLVRAQIKCCGVADTIKIRKHGFPVRLPFKIFLHRYRFIYFDSSSGLENSAENCEKVLHHCTITDYRFGQTKVFLRHSHIHRLCSALQQLVAKVVVAQKMVRGRLARIDFDFLQTTRKQEERNLGNLLVSISSRSNKMHDNLLILNDTDQKRHDRIREKELKKRDGEKENQIHKRKLTNASITTTTPTTDPDVKMREFRKTRDNVDDLPNKKAPRNKNRPHNEPLIRNFTSSAHSAWCRVDCYERQHHMASFHMDEAVICVDGTHPFSDKNRIAFAALPSKADDPKVAKVKSCIGKGVQLHQDERQNLWATRLGKNPIFVRGHTLCPELVKLNGKLTQGVPMKVLDTAAFKDYMREEVDNNGGVSEEVKERIMSKLKICMSFIKDTAVDEETPCWFEIWLLKVKDQVKRYLENQQKREKRKSGHLDMRVQSSHESTKRLAGMPEMRRAKSGDHIRSERRPRSNTTNTGISDSPTSKVPRPSRPPSQVLSLHQIATDKSLSRQQTWHQQQQEMKITQDMLRREKSMDLIRREKSMDVRVESRMLLDREYRHSMGRPLVEHTQLNRARSGNSPGSSPPQSLMRSSGSTSSNSKRESVMDSPRLTNGSGTPSPHDMELKRGNSVTAAREGMSYRQVFGLQSSDYLFNVTPPNYTRHRRFSDSDTESLHNFNFIHKVIKSPATPPQPTYGRNSPPQPQPQQQQPQPQPQPQPQQQHSVEDKGNILPKKWMKKVRRKSEDNPKRKLVGQTSNK